MDRGLHPDTFTGSDYLTRTEVPAKGGTAAPAEVDLEVAKAAAVVLSVFTAG